MVNIGVKKTKILGTAFVPELFGRREIGQPQAGAKTNGLIAKHVHTRWVLLVSVCIT